MNEQELQAIKERAKKATVGPWRLDLWDGLLISDGANIAVLKAGQGKTIKATGEDIRFIAHAREDVPSLIGEVERLREALNVITDLEIFDGKDRAYYQELAIKAFVIACRALEGDKQ